MRVYVGFPVEIPNRNFGENKFENLHITLAYWPDITAVRANQIADWIASTSIWAMGLSGYRTVQLDHAHMDLFGPNEDIPVIRLTSTTHWNQMHDALVDRYYADTTYELTPHVTVPLRLAIRPPREIIIRPIHMWRGKKDPHPIVRKK